MSHTQNRWINVPADSALSLTITSNGQSRRSLLATARVSPTLEADGRNSDCELDLGPTELITTSDVSCSIRIFVKFFGSSKESATITANVIDGNDDQISDQRVPLTVSSTLSGRASDQPKCVTLLLLDDQ